MSSMKSEGQSPQYWRSLDHLAESEEFRRFAEGEFPSVAPELDTSSSRRAFLKLMGASVALAGLTACRWPEETIVPYASRPEGHVPGVPKHFATAMEMRGFGLALLATSFDGRPIKVDGNPDHPSTRGKSDPRVQASVLDLYDPLRSTSPATREQGGLVNRSTDNFDRFLGEHATSLRETRGEGLCILTEASSSATLAAQKARLARVMPQAAWFEYEPLSNDNERAGTAMVLGAPHRALYHLERADVVACFDADPFGDHPDAIRLTYDYAKTRRGDDFRMSRLYALESSVSLTGSNADHRVPLDSGRVTRAAMALAASVILERGADAALAAGPLADVLRGWRGALKGDESALVDKLAEDLIAHRGRVALFAGSRQPAEVHAALHLLNLALNGEESPVSFIEERERPSHASAIASLVSAIKNGGVETLVILGGNPVYDAPADLDFGAALGTVPTSIHLATQRNETSLACSWHVPRAHYLEAWDDARAFDGTQVITQPLIAPLYEGRTPAELLARLMGDVNPKAHDLVREALGLGDAAWRRALHDGFVADSAPADSAARLDSAALAEALSGFEPGSEELGPDALELTFVADYSVLDGRFAGNHWMLEMPDPLTKLVWENALLVGPATADELGVAQGDLVQLEVGSRRLENVPVYVMPGQAKYSLALGLGYGRETVSEAARGKGVDAYKLRTSSAMGVARGVRVTPAGGSYELVTTQDHFALDKMGQVGMQQRMDDIVRQATLDEYRADPKHVAQGHHKIYLWDLFEHPQEYDGHKWAMAIDLSTCTGCAACTLACQAENNIPVVGKERVGEGREMHWIRVDRYFSGAVDTPRMVHQPVTCMHCEDAPCEQVCPVAATVHDHEGINVMVYNRCVGTRYCSNNCPYKVRRFNYFNYRKTLTDLEAMQFNPEVTVRSRGVMEKCTFCQQRIEIAKINAKVEGRSLEDGDVVTACQQACPADAIVFGDLNEEGSRVRKLHESYRTYSMLEYLNVNPRVRYQVKLRNFHPDLAPEQVGPDHGHGEAGEGGAHDAHAEKGA